MCLKYRVVNQERVHIKIRDTLSTAFQIITFLLQIPSSLPRSILLTNEIRHSTSGNACFQADMTVNNLIDGYAPYLFTNKSGTGEKECPTQINILRDFGTPSAYFDGHHQKVKRKGILVIVVMAAVVLTIVILIAIWQK